MVRTLLEISEARLIVTERRRVRFLPSRKISGALFAIGLVLFHCSASDRTTWFEKGTKQVYIDGKPFLFLLGVVTVAILSVCKSRSRSRPPGLEESQPLLSRDQTDEWKGWMQFLVLLYHYIGASRVFWIYEIIRVLVAAFLFLTGFGHAMYFYTKDDYSLQRLAAILVRLNLFSCLLAYTMKTDYLFYYFAPLSSFWFVVIYFTMRIGHKRNGTTIFVVAKIVFSAALVVNLMRAPGIMERIFLFLEYTCGTKWDLKEWRFRVLLDAYIVYVGMLVAIFYANANKGLEARIRKGARLSLRLKILGVAISVGAGPIFWHFTRMFPDKFAYNVWHPYISCIPILAYVILRNSSQTLRNYHSPVFAWLGRCSLETFTLQFHIWLAADTKGILSTGLFKRFGALEFSLDFILLTTIFLWMSHKISEATNTLTSWIVDPSAGRSEADIIELPVLEPHPKPGHQSKLSIRGGLLSIDKDTPKKRTRPWWLIRKLQNIGSMIRDSLKLRLVLILSFMWICNWASMKF
jgi:hypothetical protein